MRDDALDREAWQVRRTSFGSVAAGYAAHRPDYPADAVAFLLGERPRRVLDLGAGTGLLTGVLLAAGHEVVAVDPSEPMLAELRRRHPRVAAHVGDAEAVPLPDGSVDAVVAGQAAHWFDPEPAAVQLQRVLRPGGVVGLVWNTRDEEVPWVAALGRALAAEARGHEADQGVVQAFARALDARVEHHRSAVVQRLTPRRWSPASPPAATPPRWTTPGGSSSSARCAPCSTPTQTPAAATSSTCPTAPTPTGCSPPESGRRRGRVATHRPVAATAGRQRTRRRRQRADGVPAHLAGPPGRAPSLRASARREQAMATRAGRLSTALVAAVLLGTATTPAAADPPEPVGYAALPMPVTGADGAPTDDLDSDYALALDAVDAWWRAHWSDYFPGGYTAPGLAPAARAPGLYDAPAEQVYCGDLLLPEGNAYHCPIGDFLAFEVDLMLRSEQLGDAFVYLVVAHEWAHSMVSHLDPALVEEAYELQADCLAGAALQGAVDDGLLRLEDGDLEEFTAALTAVAGENAWGTVYIDENGQQQTETHGTAQERTAAFGRGGTDGVRACLPNSVG